MHLVCGLLKNSSGSVSSMIWPASIKNTQSATVLSKARSTSGLGQNRKSSMRPGMSAVRGEADEIRAKADTEAQAATLSCIDPRPGAAQGRPGAISGRMTPEPLTARSRPSET